MKRRVFVIAALALVGAAAFAAVRMASAPSGVMATVLARGTFEPFNVRPDPHGPIDDFRAHSTGPIDIVVRQHDYAPRSNTGWHQHPGPTSA